MAGTKRQGSADSRTGLDEEIRDLERRIFVAVPYDNWIVGPADEPAEAEQSGDSQK